MKNIEQKVNKMYSWQGGRASQLPRQEKNHQKLCYIYIPKYWKYQDSLEPIGALLSARITENLTVLWLLTIFINTCTVRICDPFYMVHVLVSLYREKISLNLVQFFFFFIRENSIIYFNAKISSTWLHVLVYSVWACTKISCEKKFTIKFC